MLVMDHKNQVEMLPPPSGHKSSIIGEKLSPKFEMMGYQESLEFYLKMSRKELQQLCKQHDLPANRSHAQLAKSLFSLSKKRNARSSVSQEKLVDGSSKNSFLEPKTKHSVNPSEESARGLHGSLNSSKVDIHGQSFGTNKIPGDDMSPNQAGNQVEVIDHRINITSEKPQTSTKVLCPLSHATNKGAEGSSTSNCCNMGTRSCNAANIQEFRTNHLLNLESKELGTRSESGNSLRLRNSDQKLIQDVITGNGNCNTALVPSAHNRPHEYSMESGFISGGEISVRIPSLQFFVMSEGGINLYVDLNSSPLEWINSLKDDVCVHQNGENHESGTVSKDISNSPEVEDHIKISQCADIAMDIQGIGVEQNTGCTNSSLSSVVSENCNSEAYPPDTTAATSGSSVLTSGSAPAGLSRCLEENQVVSSSCEPYAVQNHLPSDIASCPQEGLDQVHASFEAVKSNAPLPDASMKYTTNMNNGATNPVTIDVVTTKSASADFVGFEENVVSNTNNLPLSNKMEDSTVVFHDNHLKNHSGACEASFAQCTNELPDNANPHGGLSNSSQLNGHMVLDGPMADAQSEVGAADVLFHRQACSNCGTLVPEDPTSTFEDESGQTTPIRGKKASECSRVQTSDNSSKRSNNLEIPEELHAKRQHICCQNMSRTSIDIKNIRSSAKESIPDVIVMPRRSTRLVSK
ncbi:hypothetical protein Cni_G26710 [Canna indica]|uniref:Uncharacterized protein n=1 Tax=Canna indica TaxID=4628 RepID=A0AAQ3L2P3_9LILI|nr:hypothetical protein Cni_G26710 [Canna indica]